MSRRTSLLDEDDPPVRWGDQQHPNRKIPKLDDVAPIDHLRLRLGDPQLTRRPNRADHSARPVGQRAPRRVNLRRARSQPDTNSRPPRTTTNSVSAEMDSKPT